MARADQGQAARGATIADVAERAGVGVSTVSRVLNDGQVSTRARDRVLAAMSDLATGRAPARGRSPRAPPGTLGLVIPFFTHPSAVERVRGVLAAVDETAYELIVCNVATRRSATSTSAGGRRSTAATGC